VRLPKVERPEGLRARLFLGLVRAVTGRKPPDVLKAQLYRAGFWGRPYSRLVHRLMRGPSPWTVGERELFAAFVSRKNQCPF
jgi:hypothetical protein